MKPKLVPWLFVAVLLAGVAGLYLVNRKQTAELAQLQEDSQQLQQLRATAEDSKKTQAQTENEELNRLRKENEDLLRLRNEVRQLRDEKQQLGKQVQTAQTQMQSVQAQAQNAQAQAAALRESAAQAAAQASTGRLGNAQSGQPMTPEQQAAFAARYGLPPPANPVTDQDKANVCINNLRQLDGAKQQWALENKKSATAFVSPSDVIPYLKGNVMPTCPAGGVYTLGLVNAVPVCSVPGHALAK
jgi:TolA-binding protein